MNSNNGTLRFKAQDWNLFLCKHKMTHTKANFFPTKHAEMGTPNIEINSKSQAEKAFHDKMTLPCNSFQGQRCIEPILTSSEYLLSSTNSLMLLLSSVLPFPIHQHQPQKKKEEGRQERWNNREWESQTNAFWVQRLWTEQRRLRAHSCSTAWISSSQVALNDTGTNCHGEY